MEGKNLEHCTLAGFYVFVHLEAPQTHKNKALIRPFLGCKEFSVVRIDFTVFANSGFSTPDIDSAVFLVFFFGVKGTNTTRVEL
jgi:hypothetical protein